MKKILTLTTLFAALLTLVGCEKMEDDTPDGMIEIFAESMNGGSKVILDGLDATWRSGDEIRINGSTATVERRGDRAYISDASISEGTNRALYPASLSTVNWGTDNPTITFPAYYHYRTDSAGHQVLDLPMAAYSTGSTPLQFKHLTGALYITVKNNHSAPLKLLSISVSSNNYQLSGSREISINPLLIEPTFGASSDDRTISIFFDAPYVLASGSSVRVMLPILPVDANNQFTIKVKSYADGQPTAFLYSNTQPSGGDHSLARNQLGYAPVNITASGSAPFLEQSGGRYLVRTPMEFAWMADGITSGSIANNAAIDILDDFDMSGYPITAINNPAFAGTVDGHGHTISNLTVNSMTYSKGLYLCALFGRVATPIIKDLNINGLVLHHTGNVSNTLWVSGLVGYSEPVTGSMTIENCRINISEISVSTTTGKIYFGGLAGATKTVNISNCAVTAPNTPFSLSGSYIYFGGLMGSIDNDPTNINDSKWSGSATLTSTSSTRAGGLVGTKVGGNLIAKKNKANAVLNINASGTNYYGSMIGYYNQGSSIVDTTSNHLSFVVNSSPVATHFGN